MIRPETLLQTYSGEDADASVASLCPYCGVGCQTTYHVKNNRVLRVLGRNGPSNLGRLCVKGRFGFDFVQSNKRLTTPLIKRNGKFEEASWDEALDYVAKRLSEVKKDSGPDSVMAFSSAKCTNEENYLMQKFVRAAVGTNNIDHCART